MNKGEERLMKRAAMEALSLGGSEVAEESETVPCRPGMGGGETRKCERNVQYRGEVYIY